IHFEKIATGHAQDVASLAGHSFACHDLQSGSPKPIGTSVFLPTASFQRRKNRERTSLSRVTRRLGPTLIACTRDGSSRGILLGGGTSERTDAMLWVLRSA